MWNPHDSSSKQSRRFPRGTISSLVAEVEGYIIVWSLASSEGLASLDWKGWASTDPLQ